MLAINLIILSANLIRRAKTIQIKKKMTKVVPYEGQNSLETFSA